MLHFVSVLLHLVYFTVTLAHYDVNTALHNASALYNKAFCQLTKTATWDIQSAFRVSTALRYIFSFYFILNFPQLLWLRCWGFGGQSLELGFWGGCLLRLRLFIQT